MTAELKAELEKLFKQIVDFIKAIINGEFPELAEIIK